MQLAFNLENKLLQTPLSTKKALVPLFEAIANSFNAIDEAKIKDGKVTISILREPPEEQPVPLMEFIENQPITGFTVEDNGIGFTDENLQSFFEVYSARKRSQGGKGIGRITWLKAFSMAKIDSTYVAGNELRRRSFDFAVNNNNDPVCTAATGDRRTIVHLVEYHREYQHECPRKFDTIARRIISHFIQMFILDKCPEIILTDEYEKTSISLNRLFTKTLRLSSRTQAFHIGKHKFKIEHLCLALTQHDHELHLCAVNRSVFTQPLNELIPSLRGPLTHTTSGKPCVYAGYVSGPLLEQTVDELRGAFSIPDEGSLLETDGELTWQELLRTAAEKSNVYLSDYLKPLRESNNERITNYIKTREPKYRPLAKHRSHWFDRIPPSVKDDALGVELYKLWQEYDRELIAQRPKKPKADATAASIAARKKKFNTFLTEWNDQGMAKLADYVVHRQTTLEFLEESLALLTTNEYAAEDQIHSIVCPMKATSDDIPPEQLNLWLIDERLAYHHYLASDEPMSALEPVNTDSRQRGDLIIFNRALSFADGEAVFGSVVIVEFKRPMRKDYTEKENPIAQVYRYVTKLRSGEATDRHGRPLPKLEATPFYAYIICDITPKLREFIVNAECAETPDGQGFYKYHTGHHVYIEIISFQKLLDDAKKRNRVFADKLNLFFKPGEDVA